MTLWQQARGATMWILHLGDPQWRAAGYIQSYFLASVIPVWVWVWVPWKKRGIKFLKKKYAYFLTEGIEVLGAHTLARNFKLKGGNALPTDAYSTMWSLLWNLAHSHIRRYRTKNPQCQICRCSLVITYLTTMYPCRSQVSCKILSYPLLVLGCSQDKGNLRKGGRCFQDFSGSTASISQIPHQRPQIGRICICGFRNRRLSIVQEAQRLFHMVKHSLMAAWK